MRTHIILSGALATLVVATPAFADDKMEVGAFVGLHLWSDNNDLGAFGARYHEEIENSPIFGMRIARRFIPALSLEGELGVSPGTTHETSTDVAAIAYRLHFLVHPWRSAGQRFEPFALVGIGGVTSASADPDRFTNDSDFEVHGGVGFKVRVGRDWGFRFDARLIVPPAADGFATADGEFLIGIYKAFPPKPVKLAEAPPAPAPPPPAETPAPPPPPPDRDADGVIDANDKCPDEAEDRDGFEDADGCPDPDNDHDGVPDAADKCDGQAETMNGYQDGDGCPDEPPAAVKKFSGAIRGIVFATGSAKLAARSNATLDGAVKVLTDYPDLRIEIGGHTDATGDAQRNRNLSQRRAESVEAYLVGKGIAADRLTAVGYGPDKPVADNATAAGRTQNRRVEFTLR